MILSQNFKFNKIFNTILVILYFIFIGSIIITDGYPINNDILYIFKISSLEGNLKFINGLYGPGYTYYSLIFSSSLVILSFVICFLVLSSGILLSLNLKYFSKNVEYKEKINLYLVSLLFQLIIILSINFNHSEGIFLLLFYNGVLLFILGYYFKKNIAIYSAGLLTLGISLLFRQHGVVALFFLYLFFIIFETFDSAKPFFSSIKKYFIFGCVLICPLLISLTHLYLIDSIRMWQTSFRLHMIFFVEQWGDWRDLKYLLKDYDVKNFNISKVGFNDILIQFINFSLHALKTLYPFLICFVICFIISQKKIILIALIFFISFILIILPGFHNGYIPGLILCFISILMCFKELKKKKITSYFVLFFLFGHLVYLTERYYEKVSLNYIVNKDIKNNIVPYLNQNDIKYKNIFSDHLSFYTNKIGGNIHNICNWGGWFLMHPFLDNYYPREVILGKENNYCDVKILITQDKKIFEEYVAKTNINLEFKTNLHYVLKVN